MERLQIVRNWIPAFLRGKEQDQYKRVVLTFMPSNPSLMSDDDVARYIEILEEEGVSTLIIPSIRSAILSSRGPQN